MDLDHPFSEAFGRASTRNEMIISSEVVYNRLMKLSLERDILSYTVFDILLLQEDGSEDREKRRALRNLFRPDGDDNLPLLSFVQTCDTIYKRIRYFRASVGNASVIGTLYYVMKGEKFVSKSNVFFLFSLLQMVFLSKSSMLSFISHLAY